jgi:hypothetical protein
MGQARDKKGQFAKGSGGGGKRSGGIAAGSDAQFSKANYQAPGDGRIISKKNSLASDRATYGMGGQVPSRSNGMIGITSMRKGNKVITSPAIRAAKKAKRKR